MAFYKEDNGSLLSGDNFVFSPIVTLKAEDKDNFTYPQDGWYWFDTEDEANSFLGLEKGLLPNE